MFKTKVLIVGPAESGKTVISNVLAEATEKPVGEYNPTQGVRILEFEVPDVKVSGREVKAEVELWDCSGDRKYENCWPAFAQDVDGILFVCNPDRDREHSKELQTWYGYYVEQQGIKANQCIVLSYSKSQETSSRRPNLSGNLSKLEQIQTSLENDGEDLKSEFKLYLSNLLATISERREQEELGILNNR